MVSSYCISRSPSSLLRKSTLTLQTAYQISALAGSNQAEHAADLYTYLVSKPQYATSDARKALVRRLRETLVKDVIIVGVPKALEAVFAIAKVERAADKDYSPCASATDNRSSLARLSSAILLQRLQPELSFI